MPLISVVMSVFNGEQYLKEAIDSVLCQTLGDFEFIIINDCSQDNSINIIKSYNDPRINLIENNENIGITRSLIRGFQEAKGKFIARMDADDICYPNRLEKQVAFLNENIDIIAVGSYVKMFGNGKTNIYTMPLSHHEIKSHLILAPPLIHPSVMMRKEALDKNKITYNPEYQKAQDYELWVRLARVGKLANIPEVLLMYRLHPGQVSNTFRSIQDLNARKVRNLQLTELGIYLNQHEEDLYNNAVTGKVEFSADFIMNLDRILAKIIMENQRAGIYETKSLEKYLGEVFWRCCRPFFVKRLLAGRYYWSSTMKKYTNHKIKVKMKLIVATILSFK
jgi:glycosyltransferase involved in cell wall biosynthesis